MENLEELNNMPVQFEQERNDEQQKDKFFEEVNQEQKPVTQVNGKEEIINANNIIYETEENKEFSDSKETLQKVSAKDLGNSEINFINPEEKKVKKSSSKITKSKILSSEEKKDETPRVEKNENTNNIKSLEKKSNSPSLSPEKELNKKMSRSENKADRNQNDKDSKPTSLSDNNEAKNKDSISKETDQKNKENYFNNNTKKFSSRTSQEKKPKKIFLILYGIDDKIIQNSPNLFKGKIVEEKYVNSFLEKNKEKKENNVFKVINKKMKEKMFKPESEKIKAVLLEMFLNYNNADNILYDS